MAACVAADEADGGVASQEGTWAEGKGFGRGLHRGRRPGAFLWRDGLVCEIAKARGFLCKNVIRARQSLHGVPRVQFRVVLYEFVTADKLEG